MRYVLTQNGLSSAGVMQHAAPASTQSLAPTQSARSHLTGPLETHGVHGRAEREHGSWCSAFWVLSRQDGLLLCSEGSRVAVNCLVRRIEYRWFEQGVLRIVIITPWLVGLSAHRCVPVQGWRIIYLFFTPHVCCRRGCCRFSSAVAEKALHSHSGLAGESHRDTPPAGFAPAS